jgi:hypothetical protein
VGRIREAINSDSALGAEEFLAEAEGKLGRSVRIPVRGRPPLGLEVAALGAQVFH